MRTTASLACFILTASAAVAADGPVFSVRAGWEAGVAAAGAATARVTITVQPGWHVNSNRPLDEFLIPTRVELDLPPGWRAEPAVFPPHREVRLKFSDGPVAVFEGSFEVRVGIQIPPAGPRPAIVRGRVEAQACNDAMCMPPAEVGFELALDSAAIPSAMAPEPPAGTSAAPIQPASGGLAARFASSGFFLQLLIVFLLGLALNLTPCVYPLIPITVGFFMAQKDKGRGRTWLLALAYVLGMSVTYSVLGVAAALSGRLFGAALQSPWVTAVIVVVMLALAASMFGLWELRVPTWATQMSGGRAGIGGAAIMGLVVGFVAAPCIGPFVLALLTYVGQRGDVWFGLAMFFTLSLGLGVPYLVLAVSTRALDRLPNSGMWMIGVRQLFGVLLLGLAAYFLRPLLPGSTGDWLLAAVLTLGGLYLLVIARPGADLPAVDRFMRLASVALVVAGVVMAPRPRTEGVGPAWQPYDESVVSAAVASGEPVILDFYATWCLPCKELDEKTFSDIRVATTLGTFKRFKVDLTRSDARNEAIRRKFEVAGVPTIAFFAAGREVPAARLTGFEPPAQFLARLHSVSPGPSDRR